MAFAVAKAHALVGLSRSRSDAWNVRLVPEQCGVPFQLMRFPSFEGHREEVPNPSRLCVESVRGRRTRCAAVETQKAGEVDDPALTDLEVRPLVVVEPLLFGMPAVFRETRISSYHPCF